MKVKKRNWNLLCKQQRCQTKNDLFRKQQRCQTKNDCAGPVASANNGIPVLFAMAACDCEFQTTGQSEKLLTPVLRRPSRRVPPHHWKTAFRAGHTGTLITGRLTNIQVDPGRREKAEKVVVVVAYTEDWMLWLSKASSRCSRSCSCRQA
jgi:hypothetical protein